MYAPYYIVKKVAEDPQAWKGTAVCCGDSPPAMPAGHQFRWQNSHALFLDMAFAGANWVRTYTTLAKKGFRIITITKTGWFDSRVT